MSAQSETRVPEVYAATIPVISLSLIAVVLRLVGRGLSKARFWWDDWSIVVAVILNILLGAGWWLMISIGGFGRHTKAYGGPVDMATYENAFKILLGIQMFYFATAIAIKTSLILLYYRIFGVIRWFRWVLAAAWVIVALYFVIDVFVAIFECKPVAYYWDKTIKGGKCIDEPAFYRYNGVANLLIDFMIWSLTLPVIWRLQLNTRQKLCLSCIFLLGLVACAASIVRVVSFNEVNVKDFTYTNVTSGTWSTIEMSVGIICACLPAMRPLFGPLFHGIHSSHGHSSKGMQHDDAIPLSFHSSPHKRQQRSIDSTRAGFSRLDEERRIDINTVSTHAGKTQSNDLPVYPAGIMTKQTVEQHVDSAF